MTRCPLPHCATCECAEPDRGHIDVNAPFYRLVIELDRIVHAEYRARQHQQEDSL
jgi:hypothetical protein